jgi:hypothetical protein
VIECSRFLGLLGNQAVCPPTFNANRKRHLQSGHASCSQHTHSCHCLLDGRIFTRSFSVHLFDLWSRKTMFIIIHDNSSEYEGNECPTNPDIAGLGVSPVKKPQPHTHSRRLTMTGCHIIRGYGGTHHSSLYLCCLSGRGVGS